MRIASKIFLTSTLAILLLGGVAAWSIVAVSRLAEVNRDIAMRAVPAIEIANGLPEGIRRLVRLEAKYLVLRDRAYADLWNERATRVGSDLDRLGTLLASAEERKWHGAAVDALSAYRGHVAQERAFMARGEVERAQQVADRGAREAAEQAEASVVKLTAASNAALALAQSEAAALAARTWTAVVLGFAASLVGALVITAIVAVRMTRSLRQLSAATRELADGAFAGPLAVDRDDEIGDLGRAFNRMAERLKEVDALKEDFFSQISHDLRNPLTGMRGAVQLLTRGSAGGPLEPRQLHMLRVVDESVERMLAMVNQILEFTRLRARLMPIERQPVDLAKVVARTIDEMHPQAEEAGLTLSSTTSGSDFTVHADEAGLMRVVTNLVGNAVKFTPRGGSVTAQLRDWNAEVELRVSDTGAGIPADALPRIFDPYRQAHADRKGSGLGLAVVKGMVEAHGGRVVAESTVGEGSTFVVTLPRGQRAA